MKCSVTKYWNDALKQQAREMSSLKYLNLQMCSVEECHPVWETGTDPRQVPMATVRAAILTGRYTLTGEKCAGTRRVDSCPYCTSQEAETLEHFILGCALYDDIRRSYIAKLEDLSGVDVANLPHRTKLQSLVDPSHLTVDRDQAVQLERSARHHFFKMHHRRAVHDGRGSMQLWATKRGKTPSRRQKSQTTQSGPTVQRRDSPPGPTPMAVNQPGPPRTQGSPA